MQIVIHVGTRSALESYLDRMVSSNKLLLKALGVKYFLKGEEKEVVSQIIGGAAKTPWANLVPSEVFNCGQKDNTILLNNQHFLGSPDQIIKDGMLYPWAEKRLLRFSLAFPTANIKLILVARPIAELIVDVKNRRFRNRLKLDGVEAASNLSWFELAARIQGALPSASLMVLDGTTLPMQLPRVFRSAIQLPEVYDIVGEYFWLSRALKQSEESAIVYQCAAGQQTLKKYLEKESTTKLPKDLMLNLGWDDQLIDQLMLNYESDIRNLSNLTSVITFT